MSLRDRLLWAARADGIPAGTAGLWTVHKVVIPARVRIPIPHDERRRMAVVEAGTYTQLYRLTLATMHEPLGECVMLDAPYELNTHLDFMLKARGRVLITGLGLGCVVRGCLANPAVRHVVCIEKDPDVLKLVAPHMPKERLTIIMADALEWVKKPRRFDCVWHDIWTDTSEGENHLAIAHMDLLCSTHSSIKPRFQGAWAFPRHYRKLLPDVI